MHWNWSTVVPIFPARKKWQSIITAQDGYDYVERLEKMGLLLP